MKYTWSVLIGFLISVAVALILPGDNWWLYLLGVLCATLGFGLELFSRRG